VSGARPAWYWDQYTSEQMARVVIGPDAAKLGVEKATGRSDVETVYE